MKDYFKLFTSNKFLFTFILNLYLSIIGLTWIFFHLWLRFFINRSAYTLVELKSSLQTYHYILFGSFILIHIGLICSMLYVLYRLKYPLQKKSILYHIVEKFALGIDFLYYRPLNYIHDLVAPHIPASGRFFMYTYSKWKTKSPSFFYALIFTLDSLPKLIIAWTFFIEIVIMGQIKYFLYVLPLIFIPIMFAIFLKVFHSFALRNMPIVKEIFSNIEGINPIYDEYGEFVDYEHFNFTIKPGYEEEMEEYIDILFDLVGIGRFIEQINEDMSKLNPYITLLTSSLYVIGGSYRLIYLFYL